jgi:hypothetical protein
MRARQNGRGSIDAPYPCENERLSGKFLAKLVSLKEDIQLVNAAVVRE